MIDKSTLDRHAHELVHFVGSGSSFVVRIMLESRGESVGFNVSTNTVSRRQFYRSKRPNQQYQSTEGKMERRGTDEGHEVWDGRGVRIVHAILRSGLGR